MTQTPLSIDGRFPLPTGRLRKALILQCSHSIKAGARLSVSLVAEDNDHTEDRHRSDEQGS
jgi:hypothetical protein